MAEKKYKGAPFGTQTARYSRSTPIYVIINFHAREFRPKYRVVFVYLVFSSRFDVSAVHPQNKLPGTYTQVPYCKKATSTEVKSNTATIMLSLLRNLYWHDHAIRFTGMAQ